MADQIVDPLAVAATLRARAAKMVRDDGGSRRSVRAARLIESVADEIETPEDPKPLADYLTLVGMEALRAYHASSLDMPADGWDVEKNARIAAEAQSEALKSMARIERAVRETDG